jgi:hypothetical protein
MPGIFKRDNDKAREAHRPQTTCLRHPPEYSGRELRRSITPDELYSSNFNTHIKLSWVEAKTSEERLQK